MKKMTIIDIARLAGVGKSTVSRVINKDPGVKPATREKVERVIREQNFIPSASAQNMRLKQNKVIGIINTRIGSRSENETIRGILNILYASNYDVVFLESDFSREKTVEHMEVLREKNIAGVIIFAISDLDYSFLNEDIPVVMVAKKVEGFTSIAYDDYQAIEAVMDHLTRMGIDRPAYIGVDPKDVTTGLMRYTAYRDWTIKNAARDISLFGDFSYESGYSLAGALLDRDDTIQGIVCATDNIALGVRKFLTEAGRDDILVTGVGDDRLIRFLYPKHLSVSFGYTHAGEMAAESILKKIAGESAEDQIIKGTLKF